MKESKSGKGLATLGMFETRDYRDNSGNFIPNRLHVDLVRR